MTAKQERQLIYSSAASKHSESVLTSLYDQFTKGSNCDLTLKMSDGEIHAHRCLMDIFFTKAVISPIEATSGSKLEISDFSQSAILPLVEMMYTGTLYIDVTIVNTVLAAACQLGYYDAQKGCRLYISIQKEQIKDVNKSSVVKPVEIQIKEEPPDYNEYPTDNSLYDSLANTNNRNNNACEVRSNKYTSNLVRHASNNTQEKCQKVTTEQNVQTCTDTMSATTSMEQREYCGSLNLMSAHPDAPDGHHGTSPAKRTRSRTSRCSTGNEVPKYTDLDDSDISQLMEADDFSAKRCRRKQPRANMFKKKHNWVTLSKGPGISRNTWASNSRVERPVVSGYKLPADIAADSVEHILLDSVPKTTIKFVSKKRNKKPEYTIVNESEAFADFLPSNHNKWNSDHANTVTKSGKKSSENNSSTEHLMSGKNSNEGKETKELIFSREHNEHGVNINYTYSNKTIKVKKRPVTTNECGNITSKEDQSLDAILPEALKQMLYGSDYKQNQDTSTGMGSREISSTPENADSEKEEDSKLIVPEMCDTVVHNGSSIPSQETSTCLTLFPTNRPVPHAEPAGLLGLGLIPGKRKADKIAESATVENSKMKLRKRKVKRPSSLDSDSDSGTEPIEVPMGMKYVRNTGLVPISDESDTDSDSEPIVVPEGMMYLQNVGLVADNRGKDKKAGNRAKQKNTNENIPRNAGESRKKIFLSHIEKQRAQNHTKYVICHPAKPVVRP